jgi:hypothetical protein
MTTKHKHYFKCPECSQISSFVNSSEIPGNMTYEASCYCGIMTHEYMFSKQQVDKIVIK